MKEVLIILSDKEKEFIVECFETYKEKSKFYQIIDKIKDGNNEFVFSENEVHSICSMFEKTFSKGKVVDFFFQKFR